VCLQEENSLRQRRQMLLATVEKLIVEKEKLLKTIRSSGNASHCSCPNPEEGCINCLSNSELSALAESSSNSTTSEPMTVVPYSCDSGTDTGNEDDDDDDEAGRLYIDTGVSDEDSKVLDLSAKERHVKMELTDSDSLPSSSQESASSQEYNLHEEAEGVALFPNQKVKAASEIPVSFALKDYIKEESMEMEDSDYVMSSQESSQSIYSSQDSIDGSFLKHGGRTCEVSCD
jgi:hypothetical protein